MFSLYNVAPMCVFRADHLVLDSKSVCFFLEKNEHNSCKNQKIREFSVRLVLLLMSKKTTTKPQTT